MRPGLSILFALAIIIVSLPLPAQNNNENSKLGRKVKRAFRKENTTKYRSPIMIYPIYWGIQDTRATPGIYRVFGGGAAIRSKKIRPNHIIENMMQGNFGLGYPNFDDGAFQYNSLFFFESSYMRSISSNISVGANGFIFQHSRFIPALSNSSFNSDVAAGIGPLGRYKTTMKILKKETELELTLSLPIVTFVNRIPEFGLSFSGSNSFVAPIGRFNRLSVRLDATRSFKKSKENKINYFYRWDYYGMNEFDGLHNLRIASHQVGFHLWIKRN